MAQRDALERAGRKGGRAARRGRMHDFIDEDDLADEGDVDDDDMGVSQMKRRTRRQYDERRDIDDADGIEDVRMALRGAVFSDEWEHRKYPSSN